MARGAFGCGQSSCEVLGECLPVTVRSRIIGYESDTLILKRRTQLGRGHVPRSRKQLLVPKSRTRSTNPAVIKNSKLKQISISYLNSNGSIDLRSNSLGPQDRWRWSYQWKVVEDEKDRSSKRASSSTLDPLESIAGEEGLSTAQLSGRECLSRRRRTPTSC